MGRQDSGWKAFRDELLATAASDCAPVIHYPAPETKKDKRAKKKRRKKYNDDFYTSIEWRQLRYSALSLSDGCCNLCGRSKAKDDVKLHVDHIIPRSKAPEKELRLSNLQVLCEDCNIGKGASCSRDWR